MSRQLINLINDQDRTNTFATRQLVRRQRFAQQQKLRRPLSLSSTQQRIPTVQGLPHKRLLPRLIPTVKNISQRKTFHSLKVKNRQVTRISYRFSQCRLTTTTIP